MATYTRQTAVPCTVKDITQGSWIQNEGTEPSGVQTNRGLVSRASVIGVLVEKKSESVLILEDGTGTIDCRTFDKSDVTDADIGDVVLVIGRPREFNGQKYMVREICKRTDKGWVEYRKKELSGFSEEPVPEPSIASTDIEKEEPENPLTNIISKIRELDEGEGADVQDIVKKIPEADNYIKTLTEEGEIFEIKPGKVKVLE